MYLLAKITNSPSRAWIKFNCMGLPFFARHLVTFDFPNGVMYLKKLPPR